MVTPELLEALHRESVVDMVKRLLLALEIGLLSAELGAAAGAVEAGDEKGSTRHAAWCCLKTVIGGWTTSRRMHEPVQRRCPLGCEGLDDWKHYVRCPRLWWPMMDESRMTRCTSSKALMMQTMQDRFGIRICAAAFSFYHEHKSESSGDEDRWVLTPQDAKIKLYDALGSHAPVLAKPCTRKSRARGL